jgi:hypothetical protein
VANDADLAGETTVAEQDMPQAVSPEEDARIGATPATFANKLYITRMAGGAKITFAETQRLAGKDEVWPRVAVFLQHADLAALHRLLDAVVTAAQPTPGDAGTSASRSNGQGAPGRR